MPASATSRLLHEGDRPDLMRGRGLLAASMLLIRAVRLRLIVGLLIAGPLVRGAVTVGPLIGAAALLLV